MAVVEGEKEDWDVVGDYTNKTLRMKADRWSKALLNEETKNVVATFFDSNVDQLVIGLNTCNQLTTTHDVQAGLRTKAVYFLKTMDEPLQRAVEEDEESNLVREQLIFGDIAPQPLDQLSTLIEEVLIPLLENPMNRDGWPEDVSDDVSQQLYSLRGTVYRTWGQLRGQTLLPLPFGLDALEKAERHALDT
ncbi:dynein beta chain, ciliary-like [Oratosquilla oratoria]|uniref:dynein beta chain, ciliary-like n=1 Tax=Oratosquilla oratoria TaxID=337810 RepID=UPI003F763ADD